MNESILIKLYRVQEKFVKIKTLKKGISQILNIAFKEEADKTFQEIQTPNCSIGERNDHKGHQRPLTRMMWLLIVI